MTCYDIILANVQIQLENSLESHEQGERYDCPGMIYLHYE